MQKPSPFETWKAELAKAVIAKIHELRRDRITAMGFDNLAQVIRIPRGPMVSNPQYTYRTTLRDIVNELPANLRKFVLN